MNSTSVTQLLAELVKAHRSAIINDPLPIDLEHANGNVERVRVTNIRFAMPEAKEDCFIFTFDNSLITETPQTAAPPDKTPTSK